LVFVAGRSAKGPIYTSPDYGTTWISNTVPTEYWSSVGSSANGSNLVAVATNGVIYYSTNMGNIWTLANAPNENWISVSSSADGSLLAAVATRGPVCISTNSGNTWFTNSTINNSGSVVMKSGSVLKPDAGSNPSPTNWQAVACSADKTRVVAGVYGGYIYISTDSGMTWTASTNAPYANWQAVASSADGTKLVAAINNGSIYTSMDSGTTWVSNNVPNSNWISIASSADSCKLVAAYPNSIYTLQTMPVPQLKLAASGGNLAFAWIKPSTNFVLQQSAELNSWSNITNTPVLDLSNLQYQVSLEPSNTNGFFRLISQ
jgi:photosystem II stability/assembly factor-like uncharacterized protein